MTNILQLDPQQIDMDKIAEAAQIIQQGGLVAFPTETVYGLGANALDEHAVDGIFRAKGRPSTDPLIVHIADVAQLDELAADVPPVARQLAAEFWAGALTLILPKQNRIPANVTANLNTVAIRMPNHPIALALIQAAGVPIAAPSANRFSRPSPTSAAHVLEDLNGHIDLVLDGGATTFGVESTVLDLTGDEPRVLRPGGVSLEALRKIIPHVQHQPIYANGGSAVSSPGTLTKHYSPSAEVRLFVGEDAQHHLQRSLNELLLEGRRVGVMIPNADAVLFYGLPISLYRLGNTMEQMAVRLFAGLRWMDQQGVDVILTPEPPVDGLGLAIRDRLLRAAEGKVVAS